jgi:hypothetical protein
MFDVDWIEAAVNRLASAWARADSTTRAEITSASHQVDDTLAVDPIHAGESRGSDRRILIADPLAVVYEVDEEQRIVSVVDVVVRRPRPRGFEKG